MLYFLFNILFIIALFSFVVRLFQSFIPGSKNQFYRTAPDSLKETQKISRLEASMNFRSQAQQELYEDNMTMGVCFARFALQVAYADGDLSQNELQKIIAFFNGANPGILRRVEQVLQNDILNPQSIDWQYNLSEAKRVLNKTKWAGFDAVIFEGLLNISRISFGFHEAKLNRIFEIMRQLNWSNERLDQFFRFGRSSAGSREKHDDSWASFKQEGQGSYQQSYGSSSFGSDYEYKQALSILGLDQALSFEEMKKRYHELARANHPDKYASMGEQMQKAATKRFQEIQDAWDKIKKHHSKS